MTMSIRARLQENPPDHVMASLDFKNAFCSIQRDHCLTVLRQLCPHQPQWLDVVSNLLATPTVINNPHVGRPPPAGSSEHPHFLCGHDRNSELSLNDWRT